jgi:copper chaperone NosL
MARLAWFLLLLLALSISGCGSRVPAELRPPEIVLGVDTCADCGMIISDLRFATAVVTPTGEDYLFDDIGDMLHFLMHRDLPEGTAFFVHDYDSREWLPADAAFYVRSDALHTPMGGGIAAFAIEARATQVATEKDGRVMDYATLLTQPASH